MLEEMKIMQVTLLKISKEHSKSGDGCDIRILGKGVEMELRNGSWANIFLKKGKFSKVSRKAEVQVEF